MPDPPRDRTQNDYADRGVPPPPTDHRQTARNERSADRERSNQQSSSLERSGLPPPPPEQPPVRSSGGQSGTGTSGTADRSATQQTQLAQEGYLKCFFFFHFAHK